jgi:hypothetical protein
MTKSYDEFIACLIVIQRATTSMALENIYDSRDDALSTLQLSKTA